MNSGRRYFIENVIKTYFETGLAALERRDYKIAVKMFRAVIDEPAPQSFKETLMLPILSNLAEAHEGLGQLYKAKLLYLRVLARKKKNTAVMDMQAVKILLKLCNLTAKQGLYKQSAEFADLALQSYLICKEKDPVDFVRSLSKTEKMMQQKGRESEKLRILKILQAVKSDAVASIPFSESVCFEPGGSKELKTPQIWVRI